MQEIRDLKTRDASIIEQTMIEMTGKPRPSLELMLESAERLNFDTFLIYSKDLEKWIFTNILDDHLVYQEFFSHESFVIVEHCPLFATARGLHYSFHKKARP